MESLNAELLTATSVELTQDSVDKIVELASRITLDDVDVPLPKSEGSPYSAPASFKEIVACPGYTISVFMLNYAHSRFPLHDHPGMDGILKVLHGSVLFDEYTTRKNCTNCKLHVGEKCADFLVSDVVTVKSQPRVLSPESKNIHRIKAVDGPAVFLDILIPGYADNCTYYSIPKARQRTGIENHVVVKKSQCPAYFWTDALF